MNSFNNKLSPLIRVTFFILLLISNVFASEESNYEIPEVSTRAIQIYSGPRSSSTYMPFKLGLEFQESNGLCPWGMEASNIQKKPLFSFNFNNASLWHVVIDTTDIEFVTNAFSYEEKRELEICLKTLLGSFSYLEHLLKQDEKTTFESWTKIIEVKNTKIPLFNLTYSDYYQFIKDRWIVRPTNDWEPRFTPQATIQHPLEYSIPLYFGLFGFDSTDMSYFLESLPYKNLFLENLREGDFAEHSKIREALQTKMSGLVFLHALTIAAMSSRDDPSHLFPFLRGKDLPSLSEMSQEMKKGLILQHMAEIDSNDLNTLQEWMASSFQVDAKMRLNLMSRRPFSEMFKNIHPEGNFSYIDFFKISIGENNADFKYIPHLFNRANYGEQFFEESTGQPKSLLPLLKCLKDKFLEKMRLS